MEYYNKNCELDDIDYMCYMDNTELIYIMIIKLKINPIAPNKGISNKRGPLSIVITKEEPIINAEANNIIIRITNINRGKIYSGFSFRNS